MIVLAACSKDKQQTPAPAIDSSAPAAFPAYAALSPDGRSFVWLTTRGTDPTHKWRRQISAGEDEAKRIAFEGEYETVSSTLTKEGWSTERRPAPSDLKLDAHLDAKPPKVVLARSGKTVDVTVGKLPYAPGSSIDIWGASADAKHVVLHVVEGEHHFAFVARVP